MLDMALTKKFGTNSAATGTSSMSGAISSSGTSSSKNAASLGQVEQIVSKDPQLKQQVDAILQDNKVPAMPTQ